MKKEFIVACSFSKLGAKEHISCLLFLCSYFVHFLNILHNVSYLKRNSVKGTLVVTKQRSDRIVDDLAMRKCPSSCDKG